MNNSMSPRDRKTFIGGAVVVTAVLVLGRGLPAWKRWDRSAHAEAVAAVTQASERRASLANAKRTVQLAGQIERQLLGVAPAFVHGDGPGAAAALASLVGDHAGVSGVRVGAISATADTGVHVDVRHISVRGDVTGDVRGITQFLAALESGAPLLSVRELTITQSDLAADANHPETLHADFVVDAIARQASEDASP